MQPVSRYACQYLSKCDVLCLKAPRWKEHTNGLRDEFANQLLEVTAASFPGHDLHHLLADLADLTALGIACALHLITTSTLSNGLCICSC